MNEYQKKYLMKRVDEITVKKLSMIQSKFDPTDLIKKLELNTSALSITKQAMELKKEFIKNKNIPTYDRYIKINADKIFINMNEVINEIENGRIAAQKNENTIIIAISNYSSKIKDQIMLGDSKEAIKMLEEFENKQF